MGTVVIEPEEGSISPAMPFSVVDLPDPFGPMIAAIWPSGIANDEGETAVLDPYRNEACSATTAGSSTGTRHTALRSQTDVQ